MVSLNESEKEKIMNQYLEKYNKETLNRDEGELLKNLLKEKQEKAFKIKDETVAIGLGFLIAGLLGYLALKD